MIHHVSTALLRWNQAAANAAGYCRRVRCRSRGRHRSPYLPEFIQLRRFFAPDQAAEDARYATWWAGKRGTFSVAAIKRWHRQTMEGLDAPQPKFIGRFRDEPGFDEEPVYIGSREGTKAAFVVGESMLSSIGFGRSQKSFTSSIRAVKTSTGMVCRLSSNWPPGPIRRGSELIRFATATDAPHGSLLTPFSCPTACLLCCGCGRA